MSDQGLILRFAHAYTPNESATYGGGEHLVLTCDWSWGRLKRAKGDALCKPAKKFWGLHDIDEAHKTCPRCLELARRYCLRTPMTVPQLEEAARAYANIDDKHVQALFETDDQRWLDLFEFDRPRLHRAHGQLRAARHLQLWGMLDTDFALTPLGKTLKRLLRDRAPEPPETPVAESKPAEETTGAKQLLDELFDRK